MEEFHLSSSNNAQYLDVHWILEYFLCFARDKLVHTKVCLYCNFLNFVNSTSKLQNRFPKQHFEICMYSDFTTSFFCWIQYRHLCMADDKAGITQSFTNEQIYCSNSDLVAILFNSCTALNTLILSFSYCFAREPMNRPVIFLPLYLEEVWKHRS